jgi:hypothetical protein
MKAGFSSVALLPPRASLAGVADDRMPRWYTSVRDEPRARAVALEDGRTRVVLVVAGLMTFPAALTAAVRARLSARLADPPDLVLHADHTHSGAGNYWRHILATRFAGPFLQENEDFLAGRLAAVAAAAWEARVPAMVRSAHGEAPGLQRHRRRPDGPLDPGLSVVAFHDASGRPLGALAHFTAHPRIVAESRDAFHAASGDWPGSLAARLERDVPVAAVLNGALGAIDPVMPDPPYDADPALRAFVDPLESAARDLLGRATPEEPVLAFARAVARLGPLRSRPFPPGFAWWTPLAWPLARLWDVLARRGLPHPEEAPVSALRVGGTALVFHPSDLGVACGLSIRERGRALGLAALPVCHTDDYAGYVQPRDEMLRVPLPRDPYRFFTIYENLMGFHGRGAAEAFAVAEDAVLRAVAGRAT